jgi:Tol biopolymer transport system component
MSGEPGCVSTRTKSPDGSDIVFTSRHDGDCDIYVMSSNSDHLTCFVNNPVAEQKSGQTLLPRLVRKDDLRSFIEKIR